MIYLRWQIFGFCPQMFKPIAISSAWRRSQRQDAPQREQAPAAKRRRKQGVPPSATRGNFLMGRATELYAQALKEGAAIVADFAL